MSIETIKQKTTHSETNTHAVQRPSAERIVLTGFMGAGKSTVGRLLAARLGWTFLDVDAEIERRAGTTVAAIFAEQGEAAFRRLESNAVARALGLAQTVIALGGGALESQTNRLLLEQTLRTTIVFLDAPFEVLFDRCVLQEGGTARPVLQNAAAASERFHQRAPVYRRTAHHRIATEDLHPADTVLEILRRL